LQSDSFTLSTMKKEPFCRYSSLAQISARYFRFQSNWVALVAWSVSWVAVVLALSIGRAQKRPASKVDMHIQFGEEAYSVIVIIKSTISHEVTCEN